ncbi:hypothetical protein AMATHDRAFT_45325 [Amanita thiersii Skay4041]|uniref:Uncharacterized protein n=1 Tax=Amanita thiersii Skay4041 TaxID=703135 RepID=A0A2A9NR41_9AGAR|nr:hypothetical protein AMATHDRAFT_45325 [Amanita thiersii Skay4041]
MDFVANEIVNTYIRAGYYIVGASIPVRINNLTVMKDIPYTPCTKWSDCRVIDCPYRHDYWLYAPHIYTNAYSGAFAWWEATKIGQPVERNGTTYFPLTPSFQNDSSCNYGNVTSDQSNASTADLMSKDKEPPLSVRICSGWLFFRLMKLINFLSAAKQSRAYDDNQIIGNAGKRRATITAMGAGYSDVTLREVGLLVQANIGGSMARRASIVT